ASQRSWIDPPPRTPIVRTAPTPDPSTVQLSSMSPPHFATPPKSPSRPHTFAAGAAIGSLTFTSDICRPPCARLDSTPLTAHHPPGGDARALRPSRAGRRFHPALRRCDGGRHAA